MEVENPRYCPNCYYPLPDYGEYCPNCSQKFTDGKVTFWVLIGDFFESVLNIDSKIFRTLGALFVPGKLTEAYFCGKQKRFVPPLRLFFVMAVVHFAIIGFITLDQLEISFEENLEASRSEAYYSSFHEELDSARANVAALYPGNAAVAAALDSLNTHMEAGDRDSMNIEMVIYDGGGAFTTQHQKVDTYDLVEMSPNELADHYEIEGFWKRLVFQQMAKLRKEGNNFARYVVGNLIWMAAFMMPALALILKLLYVRRRRYYVEHLVFSFHYHAFAFLLASVLLLIGYGLPEERSGLLYSLFFLAVLFYLYKAMRRFYLQKRFKTFVKFVLLNSAYLMIFVFFVVVLAIVTALTF